MGRLKGKNVLVTGASRGLGRALALDFAREQASGLVLVARSATKLLDVSSEIARLAPGTSCLAIEADLTRPEDVERATADTLDAFSGRLDVLVNNASALGPSPMPLLVDYPLPELRRVLDTNLVAPFLLIQKLLPSLIETGGSVINVTSDAGITGYPGWGAYGISKFALEGLTETWAAELGEVGVRVNAVDPGDMNTEMHQLAEPDGDPSEWADPADVTEVFLYLASDESRGVTGKRFLAQDERFKRPIPHY